MDRDNANDLTKVIGAMYAAVLFVGVNNSTSVQPLVAVERTVFYRERAAKMYSALPYALAQVRLDYNLFDKKTLRLLINLKNLNGLRWSVKCRMYCSKLRIIR